MKTDLEKQALVVALIPAYNEESSISKVLQQTSMYVDKIIVCDDGSTDRTSEVAKASGATVVEHERNLGYGAALSTLFSEAKKLNPDVVVTLDADGQHDPTYIPRLTEQILSNGSDVVIGSRFLSEEDQQNLPAYRRVGIRIITKLTKRATDIGITDAQSGFRAYSKKAMQTLRPKERGMGASTEILIKAKQAKLAIKEVPIAITYNGNTSKQSPITQWFRVVVNTIKIVSTRCPQIFYAVPGVLALIVALGFWVLGGITYAEAGQADPLLESMAIGTTIVGIALLAFAAILWRLAVAARQTKTIADRE